MLNAMEELMRLHPASLFGRREHRQSDFEVFEDLESRHLRPQREHKGDDREPTWIIGEVAAAVAMLVVSLAVLTMIARSDGGASNTRQQPVVAVSDAADPR
jgi:hypothetical protein